MERTQDILLNIVNWTWIALNIPMLEETTKINDKIAVILTECTLLFSEVQQLVLQHLFKTPLRKNFVMKVPMASLYSWRDIIS